MDELILLLIEAAERLELSACVAASQRTTVIENATATKLRNKAQDLEGKVIYEP